LIAELPAEHADVRKIKGSDFGPGRRATLKYVADLVLGALSAFAEGAKLVGDHDEASSS
jgi:hypothetical protein